MEKTYLPLDLQLFAEESGVEDVPAAEEQVDVQPETSESPETGVDDQAAAEPKEQAAEKAFAKRLAAEREKWEAEKKAELEQYKDYDVSKKALEYLMRQNNIDDPMTLKEQIELAELQEKAENENLTVEELQRRQELEELKAWKEQVEKQQQEQEILQQFEKSVKEFCEGKELDGKPLDHKELWNYMYENKTENPEIAYKAMKADILEKQLETAKKEGVKEFLSAKGSMPKVEGSNSSGQVIPGTPKTFAEARTRAMQRFGG